MNDFDQDGESAAQLLLERRKAASALPPSPLPSQPFNPIMAQQLAALLKRSAPKGK